MHASFPNEVFPTSILIGFETVLLTGTKPVLSIIGVNLQYVNKTTISLEGILPFILSLSPYFKSKS